MSTDTQQTISSFESRYVDLELVPYMKSGQIIPFHVFNRSVMPSFLRQLSHGRTHFHLPSPRATSGGGDGGGGATEENAAGASSSYRHGTFELFEDVKEDMAHIRNACRRLESWERDVNGAINKLVLLGLGDAFEEAPLVEGGAKDVAVVRSVKKLLKIREHVSELKESIYKPLKFHTDKESNSFKRSRESLKRIRSGEMENSRQSVQLLDVNISREIAQRDSEEIRAVYDGLSLPAKLCLLCFSVFPEDAVIKKKVLAHWWVGEGFIDDEEDQISKDRVTNAGDLFREFTEKGLIEPVYKKRRPSADSCKMKPSVRYAVIDLAERAGFAKFDADMTHPTASFPGSQRPCLVRSTADEEAGSSAREFVNSYASKQDNVRTLFNVSEVRLDFNSTWFSKMKYARVLQLGKWKSSAKHIVEADDGEFLKGLKSMKHLRYLSLRGVSRIAELPSSVCKLVSLRILNLNGCQDLLRLPEGIGSLKNLTHLDMYECYFISHMPKGISQLSALEILKGFVIGKPGLEGQYCQLEDLTKLKKLKKLSIHVDRNLNTAIKELRCLEEFKYLDSLSVSWSRIYYSSIGQKGMQRMLTHMRSMATLPRSAMSPRSSGSRSKTSSPNKLPENLKKLDLHYFPSKKISEWFSLEKIRELKKLHIRGGDSLADLSEETSCWVTVEFLRLKFLKKLPMDWRELRVLFPKLIYLEKFDCPNLCFFPCDQNGIWKKDFE